VRLAKRAGVFRALSVFLLLLGVIGAVALRIDRIEQQQRDQDAAAARLAAEVRDRQARTAASDQAARSDAQDKADAAAAGAATQEKAAADASRGGGTGTPGRPVGPIPASCAVYAGNQAIGCALLPEAGFGIDQMPCLVPMWTKESHWNEKSRNPSTGAYGIAQALPASRMATFGSDYLTNPATQIRWGLSYIKNRYKTPCGAWGFWQAHHWY
jgi:Transglycosylase SLT domain